MPLMSPLCLSVLTVTLFSPVMMTEAEFPGCDETQFREMQADFSTCTASYKAEYGEAVSLAGAGGDLEAVTCSLLDNMVTVCGEHWTRCHRGDEVEVMRAMFVESLVSRNRDATVNIETCESVRKYRSHIRIDILMISQLL